MAVLMVALAMLVMLVNVLAVGAGKVHMDGGG